MFVFNFRIIRYIWFNIYWMLLFGYYSFILINLWVVIVLLFIYLTFVILLFFICYTTLIIITIFYTFYVVVVVVVVVVVIVWITYADTFCTPFDSIINFILIIMYLMKYEIIIIFIQSFYILIIVFIFILLLILLKNCLFVDIAINLWFLWRLFRFRSLLLFLNLFNFLLFIFNRFIIVVD